MQAIENSYLLLLASAILVLAGIASSLVARRFGAPLLLVFLVLGMLVGENGPGGIRFNDYAVTYLIGSLALAVILFDGGLRTRLAGLRGVMASTLLLSSVGVVLTAAITGLAAIWALQLGTTEGLLLGAIVASTDAAAVFFLLRAGGLQLRHRVGATLEIESGANDPVAVFLTVMLAGLVASGLGHVPGFAHLLLLVWEMAVGALVGGLGGLGIASLLNRLRLPGGLAPLFALASAVALFGLAGALGGSGFLAAYLAGLVVGNRPIPGFTGMLAVNDAATWLCQIAMFLVLGLLVTPSSLIEFALPGLIIAAVLMLIGRPLAVAICLAPFGFSWREIAYVSWVGLRGAVGIFLASIPMLMRLPNAELYFNVGFIVVLVSLTVQGWTLNRAATWLRVALPHRDRAVRRVELDLPGQLELELVGYAIAPACAILGGAKLPSWAQSALIIREGNVLPPNRVDQLQAGDYAYFLAPPGRVYRLDWLFAPPGEEAREAEREAFGEFSFDGDTPLSLLAEFYELPLAGHDGRRTLAELFQDRYEHSLQVGDRLGIGNFVLIAREMGDEQVSRVGLKLEGVGGVLLGRAILKRPRLAAWLSRVLRR